MNTGKVALFVASHLDIDNTPAFIAAAHSLSDKEFALAFELYGQSRLHTEVPDIPLDDDDWSALRFGLENGVPLRDEEAQLRATRVPDAVHTGEQKARDLETGFSIRKLFRLG